MRQAPKYAINEKSTILTWISWKFGNFTYPCDGCFHQVSWQLGKYCGFFVFSIFWSLSHFLFPSLYLMMLLVSAFICANVVEWASTSCNVLWIMVFAEILSYSLAEQYKWLRNRHTWQRIHTVIYSI